MEQAKTISPVVVRTDNVTKELKRVAAANDVPLSSLDFNVLVLQTFSHIEGEDNTSDDDWKELSSDDIKELENEETALLNPKFYIRQVAEIEIFSRVDEGKFDTIDSAVGGSHQLSKIFYAIKKGSNLKYFEGFKEEFSNLIYKKKLRSGVLVGMFDELEPKSLQKVNAAVRVNKAVSFSKDTMFQVAEGIIPVVTRNDEIILHYEKKKDNVDEQDRVDHAKRGFLISAVKGEILIEYVKAKKGKAGRNCRGEYIAPKEPIIANTPTFSIDENIEIIENDDKIEYRAKISGYVTFEGGLYTISTDVEVGAINFKTTGSIDTELDADVSLNVKESDDLKDAIGNNMEVEVNEITVEGSVGSKAIVKANKATINGQTHGSSKVTADELKINLHKGEAYGRNITITRLESGIVEGDHVIVKQAIGGKIKAKTIDIKILGSHVTMEASERIEIEKTTGSENTFIINPVIEGNASDLLEKNEKDIVEAERGVRELKLEISDNLELVSGNQKSFDDVKKKLAHYKKNKVKLPSSFLKKFQDFKKVITTQENLESELKARVERLGKLEDIKRSMQGDIFNTKVINHDYWRGYNEITFKLINPEINVNFSPEENSQELCYGLKERDLGDGESEFYIDPLEYTEKPQSDSGDDALEKSESLFDDDDEEIEIDVDVEV